jgi:hypothetical protein
MSSCRLASVLWNQVAVRGVSTPRVAAGHSGSALANGALCAADEGLARTAGGRLPMYVHTMEIRTKATMRRGRWRARRDLGY